MDLCLAEDVKILRSPVPFAGASVLTVPSVSPTMLRYSPDTAPSLVFIVQLTHVLRSWS